MFSGVSYVCLQVFHLDVAYVCNGFQMFFKHFSQVFHTLVSCAFFMLHLDVSKVDRVLYMGCVWKRLEARTTFGAAWATSGGSVAPLLMRLLTSPTH
jgi:hypothetical protein